MLKPTGFWSYTSSDDGRSRGRLSQLRALLADELQQQIGRLPEVNIFQDVAAIPPGSSWERQIDEALSESSFILPVVTPAFLQSEWCAREVMTFHAREQALGRDDLIFPLHYINTAGVDPARPGDCHDPAVLEILRSRQWIDFRDLRHRDPAGEEVARILERIALGICTALRRSVTVPAAATETRNAIVDAAEDKRSETAAPEPQTHPAPAAPERPGDPQRTVGAAMPQPDRELLDRRIARRRAVIGGAAAAVIVGAGGIALWQSRILESGPSPQRQSQTPVSKPEAAPSPTPAPRQQAQDTAQRLLRTLTGHTDAVWSVTFSPNGRLLASGSEDRTIKLWDPASGQALRTLTGYAATVTSVAFSSDARLLASGSEDKTIKLWDPASGDALRTLTGHTDAVRSVAFSPDGRLLASGGEDKTIKLWDPESGDALRTLTGHASMVDSVAFSPDGRSLASGNWDHTIKLWDVSVLTSTGR